MKNQARLEAHLKSMIPLYGYTVKNVKITKHKDGSITIKIEGAKE